METCRRQVIEELLNTRLVRDWLARIGCTGGRLSWIEPVTSVHMVHLFGARVEGLYVLVGDRPGRGDPIVMWQLPEILAAQAIQRGAEQFCRTANEVVHLWLKRPTGAIVPGVGGYVAVVLEYRRRIPVLRLAFQPVTTLKDQDTLSRRRNLPCECPATRATPNDDDVVVFVHVKELKADAGLHDTAVGEDGRRCQIACAIAGEEGDHGSDLLWSRHAPQRYRCVQLR